MRRACAVFLAIVLLLNGIPAWGQGGEDDDALPVAVQMTGFRHEYQGWNNCGPATLTTALSHYGWEHDQSVAAIWLKPDPEDKNVSPWQMAEFVNTQTPQRALVRYGGTLDLLRHLVTAEFPVIIAAGYEPEGYDWMGHYLLVMGYDREAGTILTQDSFLGPNLAYPESDIDSHWRHFNRVYIVIYQPDQEADLLALLGDNADVDTNAALALEAARQEVVADTEDPFGWFNMGTSYALLGQYEEAAVAYDQSRNVGAGLPWRMLWYQFGMFEAYYETGRYEDVIALAQVNLATTADTHPIEETYYYAGLARAAMGEIDRAISNYQRALSINPNFTPAQNALAMLQTAATSPGE